MDIFFVIISKGGFAENTYSQTASWICYIYFPISNTQFTKVVFSYHFSCLVMFYLLPIDIQLSKNIVFYRSTSQDFILLYFQSDLLCITLLYSFFNDLSYIKYV